MRTFVILLKTVVVGLLIPVLVFTAYAGERKKTPLQEVTFVVNLHCENCVRKVQDNIPFEKGVKDLKVSLEDKTVWIQYSPDKTSRDKLVSAIERLGYEVLGEVETDKEKEK